MNTQQQVKALINQYIKTNGTGAITGALLNEVLQAMVGLTGLGYNFAGVATPETNPGTLTYVAFYIAGPGTYENMGGVTVPPGNIGIIDNSNNGAWTLSLLQITLADNAVTTSKLANEVVTVTKLASDVIALLNTKADIDGFYSTMGVGAAENLIGRGSVMADFTFRTSGGTADIGSGLARIRKLMGNTVVWNQKVPIPSTSISETKNDVTLTDNRDGTYSIETTASGASVSASFTIPGIADIPVGHKILLLGTPKQTDVRFYWRVNGSQDAGNGIIFTNSTAAISADIYAVFTGTAITPLVFKPQLFDLTLMFGAGKEPSTVAEFMRLFPLDYYQYNEGELISVTATGLKTVGFNAYNPATGEAFLLGGNKYQVSGTYTALSFGGAAPTLDADGCFTPAKDGILEVTGGNSTDTCVHLVWSGYRNGEYEEHWAETLALPITTLTGKLNGEGESLIVFEDGLRSSGSAYDEITELMGIKRTTKLILSGEMTLNTKGSGRFLFQAIKSTLKSQSEVICDLCTSTLYAGTPSDKINISVYTNHRIFFEVPYGQLGLTEDTPESNAAAVINSYLLEHPITLIAELDTPKEYTLDNSPTLSYKVDDFGTEEELPQNDDEPVTAPLRYEVQYAMNAVDTLRRLPENYISKESFLDFLAEFDSKVGAAINATIVSTMTFDSESQKYGFDISVTPNT